MHRRVLPLLLLLPLTALGGCLDASPEEPETADAEPLVLGDPLAVGALEVSETAWDLGDQTVRGSEGAYLVRVHGSLHAPADGSDLPVLVFMHGRHATCDGPLGETKLQPCPDTRPVDVVAPVDSYTGYDHLAEPLASLGYVVVSVDANNVNDQDNEMGATLDDDYGATARARIVLRVLEALRDAHDGDGEGGLESLAGRLDLGRVGLMGHSRGGEGVSRAWELMRDSQEAPVGVRVGAVLALAPSDFFDPDVRGVPYAVVLPYCDGDVFDLQGAQAYDRARRTNDAPQHQFLAMGANHNFYNTVWTRDDWGTRGDSWCDGEREGNGRDAPEAQREHLQAILGSFFRHYLGGEADLLPFLTGAAPWPVPAVVTSYQGGDAVAFLDDGDHELRDLAVVEGDLEVTRCGGRECPAQATVGSAQVTALAWDGSGAYRVGVRPTGEFLTFRVGVDPETVTQAELEGVRVVVRTPDGERVTPLTHLGAFVPPGDDGAKTVLNMVRVPVPEDAVEVALHFTTGEGVVLVTDWLQA